MAKRFERVFRDRPLTPEEFARDEEIRRKVREEFPPACSEAAFRPDSLSAALREAIRGSDKSVYQIAREADVSQIVISRFLSGERDIRMGTADKLAGALGLRLATGA
jgi:DNA-binding phage protein